VPRQPIGQGLLHLQTNLADPRVEPDFTRWCNEIHHAAVLHVDGFLSLRRYERVPGYRYADPDGYRFLTVYQLATPEAVDSPAHQEHGRTAEPIPEHVAAVLTYLRTVYGQCFPEAGSLTPSGVEPHPEQRIGTAVLHVMMDVEPAWELEFNAWYNDEHLVSLLAVPGFLSARRFADVAWPAAGPEAAGGRHQYLAMYELEDVSVVDSPAYAQACEMTPWTEKVAPHLAFHSQIYRQVFPPDGAFTI
jgi:hypothetical protein